VEGLSKKSYWSSLDNSPEFVICFIPTEALLSAALEVDGDLMDWAFGKRVALASPVSVWSVMKTVSFAWQQDVLTQDAKTLFDVGRELMQRLGTMAGHIDKLGRSITGTVKDYNQFLGSLEARVIPSARKLSVLGDGAGLPEQLDAVDESVREMSNQNSPTSRTRKRTPKSYSSNHLAAWWSALTRLMVPDRARSTIDSVLIRGPWRRTPRTSSPSVTPVATKIVLSLETRPSSS